MLLMMPETLTSPPWEAATHACDLLARQDGCTLAQTASTLTMGFFKDKTSAQSALDHVRTHAPGFSYVTFGLRTMRTIHAPNVRLSGLPTYHRPVDEGAPAPSIKVLEAIDPELADLLREDLSYLPTYWGQRECAWLMCQTKEPGGADFSEIALDSV